MSDLNNSVFQSFYTLARNKCKQLGIEKDPLLVNQIFELKNGQDTIFYTYLVCPYLPKCWVEGMQYQFNKVLVYKETTV